LALEVLAQCKLSVSSCSFTNCPRGTKRFWYD
jgi:hypothetical protein